MTWSKLFAGQAATEAATVAPPAGAATVVGGPASPCELAMIGEVAAGVEEIAPEAAPSTLFAALTFGDAVKVTPTGFR